MEQVTPFTPRMFLLAAFFIAAPAFPQAAPARTQPPDTPQNESSVAARQGSNTITGTVVSSTGRTMVIRTATGEHVLVVFNRDTNKPNTIAEGARVRVRSRPDAEGTHLASSVELTTEPAVATEPAVTAESTGAVPPEVRRLERQIARQAKRFRAGVRAGVGLDPEIVTAGVHATLGPFFHPDVWLRPNAEIGFGEVTTLFALNLEAIYRLPITEQQSRWTVYVGAGPGFNFIDRDFEEAEAGEREIDFDDFDYESSLNLLAGLENRNGMFLEMKTAVFSRPQVRLQIGYTF
ncbi:MAG: hypothetical protein WD733_14945 [Bryobacterales bacterium]